MQKNEKNIAQRYGEKKCGACFAFTILQRKGCSERYKKQKIKIII